MKVESNDSIRISLGFLLSRDTKHPLVERSHADVRVIVDPFDDGRDALWNFLPCVDNTLSAIPPLDHPKDVLNGVEIGRVRRKEQVLDAILRHEVANDGSVVDRRVVHHQCHLPVTDLGEVLSQRPKEVDEILRIVSSVLGLEVYWFS